MTTTSLKLPEELKSRIQALASHQGFSSHAFMVNALERAVAQAEARRSFIADAEASLEDIRNGGPVYAAEDVREWLKARIAARGTGAKVQEPTPIRGRGAKPAGKSKRA